MQTKSCKLPTMTIGFRFRPSDREIINDYLIKRMKGHDYSYVIRDIDLCRYEPWELPRISVLEDEEVWYFFCRPEYKDRNRKRINRATGSGSGSWKPTGNARPVRGRGKVEIGTKRTLVFYAKTGTGSVRDGRTTWVIHEYQVPNVLPGQSEFVFCKLKDKSDEQTYSSAVEEAEQDIQFGFEAGCDTPSASMTLRGIARIQQERDASDLEFDPNGVSAMGRKAVDYQGMTGYDWLQFDQFLCQSREDEADQLFADSLLTEPEECVKHCYLPPREYVPQVGSLRMNDQPASARQLSQAASVQIVCEKQSGSPLSLDVNQSRVKIPKRFTLHRSRRAVKVRHVPEEPELLESSELSAKCQKVSPTRQSDRQAFLESAKVSPTRLSIGQQAKGRYLHLDAKKGFPVGKKTSIRNTKKNSFTRRNTVPSHQPTPPTPFVHIVNVTVGLVLLVVVIMQMMPF